ncbi:mucin-19 isoform X3 [Folsomia candida]|uniref:mucin-19 isoform X3 n=1 Tax=Folsomia candida TaxID=158441 RepID=UPI0016052732|nr:mucin-19 isoform X3 [Folsomia candida]
MNLFVVGVVLIFGCLVPMGEAQTGVNCGTKKPTLKTGETYYVNQNCPLGKTYNWPGNSTMQAQHCHCWSYCGYICECDTSAGGGTTKKTAPTTQPAAACKNPPVPAGCSWVPDKGCSKGDTYNTQNPAAHCHCWGHCGYICDPKSGPAPAPGTTPAPAPACKQPSIPAGSTWVPDKGCSKGDTYTTQNPATHCHCWGHCGYICDPKSAPAPATTRAPAPGTTQGACKAPPSVPSGSTWAPSPGCPKGDTYNTQNPATHCHCWGHCGYICDPRSAPGPATTRAPAPGTTQATCKSPPSVPSGSTWNPDPTCPKGPTYNTATTHCHCWGHCGYICDPRAGPTAAPATTVRTCRSPPTVPPGSKWVPDPNCNNGPVYNLPTNPPFHCHCWGHCGYICDPRGSTGAVTGSTTMGTGSTSMGTGSTTSATGSTTAITGSTTAATGSTTAATGSTTAATGSTTAATGSTTAATGSTTAASTTGGTTGTTAGSTTGGTTGTTAATTAGSTTGGTTGTTAATTAGSTTAATTVATTAGSTTAATTAATTVVTVATT